jgi:hypothetical protein
MMVIDLLKRLIIANTPIQSLNQTTKYKVALRIYQWKTISLQLTHPRYHKPKREQLISDHLTKHSAQ